MANHTIRINPAGTLETLYTDLIDLSLLGRLEVRRASSIEFNELIQEWETRDAVTRVLIGHSPSREESLRFEHDHFMAQLSVMES